MRTSLPSWMDYGPCRQPSQQRADQCLARIHQQLPLRWHIPRLKLRHCVWSKGHPILLEQFFWETWDCTAGVASIRAATGDVRRAVCGNILATRAAWNTDISLTCLGNLQLCAGTRLEPK